MSYLSREDSPITHELWEKIDSEIIGAARKALTGRRFLHIYGPLGIGVQNISIDDADIFDENLEDGFITTKGRRYVEIPTLYEDFSILAKDMESCKTSGYPIDLSRAARSAEICARKEDSFLFFGNNPLGYEGILTASGINRIERSDWTFGENAFTDLVTALELFTVKGIYGPYTLILSPDLYMQLHRIQQGTGLLEIDRVNKLLNGNVHQTPVLGTGKAVIVCSDPKNIDLVIGQDLATAYLEQKDLNHSFRILESILLRIKNRSAITVFE